MRSFLKKHKKAVVAAAVFAVICAAFAACVLFKVVKLNDPRGKFPVKGVDVSSYQGEIDWEVLSDEAGGLDFAFVKATEGSSFVDKKFAYNFEQARRAGLRVGAYHFFSFDSSGETQARNFIDNVPIAENMLPPVVDVEFYGEYFDSPKSAEDVVPQLRAMLGELESHYGVKLIIYSTNSARSFYINEEFPEYELWVRSVYLKPSADCQWTFWQHSDTARLDGYNGEEKCIDMNVFNGSREEFSEYCTNKERDKDN